MSDETTLKVLVTGASGKQGWEVARQLLAHGHLVKGFTRNPDTFKIRDLEKLGATIVQGDFEDKESIREAMQGADAVFAMATMREKGPDGEIENGKALADVAQELE